MAPPTGEGPPGRGLPIRDDPAPAALRASARRERTRRAATPRLAIAGALEGMSRAEAARLVGTERRSLRDAAVRHNAEGIAGPYDRPKPGRPERPSAGEQAAPVAAIPRGPDDRSTWTLPDLCRRIEARAGKRLPPASPSRVVRRSDPPRQKARPAGSSQSRREGQGGLRKKGPGRALMAVAEAHPDRRIALRSMGEARAGQKGRLCHRWWMRGQRPPGLCGERFAWARIFAAVRPPPPARPLPWSCRLSRPRP